MFVPSFTVRRPVAAEAYQRFFRLGHEHCSQVRCLQVEACIWQLHALVAKPCSSRFSVT